MKLFIDIDPDILAESAGFETQDQAFELIKSVDLLMADYDFTLGVVRYLVGELKKCSGDSDPPLTATDLGL